MRTTISPHRFKATEEKRAKIKGIWNNLNKTFFGEKKRRHIKHFDKKSMTFRLEHLKGAGLQFAGGLSYADGELLRESPLAAFTGFLE